METGRTLRELSRPVTGWRAWTVVETPAGLRLGSVLHDLVWPAGRSVLAECRLHEDPFAAATTEVPAAKIASADIHVSCVLIFGWLTGLFLRADGGP